jgi:hypothetical protein
MLSQIFGKLNLVSGNQPQFKYDLEQNSFRNLTYVGKTNLWVYVNIVQQNTEDHNSALSHFYPRMHIEHSNTHMTTCVHSMY